MILLSQARIEDGPVAIEYVQRRNLERRRYWLGQWNAVPLAHTVLTRASRATAEDVLEALKAYRDHGIWFAWDDPVRDFTLWAQSEPDAERWEILKALEDANTW